MNFQRNEFSKIEFPNHFPKKFSRNYLKNFQINWRKDSNENCLTVSKGVARRMPEEIGQINFQKPNAEKYFKGVAKVSSIKVVASIQEEIFKKYSLKNCLMDF